MAEGTASKPKRKKLKNSKTDEFEAKKAVCNEVVHFYRVAISERPEREARWGPAFTVASGTNPESRNPNADPKVACFRECSARLQADSRTVGRCFNPVAGMAWPKNILLLPPAEIIIPFIGSDSHHRDAPDKPAPTSARGCPVGSGGCLGTGLEYKSQAAGAVLPSQR